MSSRALLHDTYCRLVAHSLIEGAERRPWYLRRCVKGLADIHERALELFAQQQTSPESEDEGPVNLCGALYGMLLHIIMPAGDRRLLSALASLCHLLS